MGNNYSNVKNKMSKEIFWLASYPKSGNTLLRSILVGLFFTNDGVFSLDKSKLITQFDTTNLIKKNQHIFSKKITIIYQILIYFISI